MTPLRPSTEAVSALHAGGALKLKGGLPIEKKKKKKKKAPKEEAEGGEGVAEGTGSASETRERGSGGEGERKVTSEGYELLDDDESGDKRTEAQKR